MDKWETLGHKLIHENSFMRLLEYDVVRPNSRRAPFYVLERFNTSIIIPLTKDIETYLVGQYRYAALKYSWEFPMGAMHNRGSLNVAKQELREETGLVAKKWQLIGRFRPANGYTSEEDSVFIAEELEQHSALPEPGEIFEIKKMTLKTVGNMINSGEIGDGPTICAYYFLNQYWIKKYKTTL